MTTDAASRIAALIAELRLMPHPEGGFYRRIYESAARVRRLADGAERLALTSIHFLLPGGAVSRWHRVWSDEAWHFHEGSPLELVSFAPGERVTATLLGPLGSGGRPTQVIPAGHWQAARSTGAYTLVGCTVGPGFDFADFALLADLPPTEQPARPDYPDFESFL